WGGCPVWGRSRYRPGRPPDALERARQAKAVVQELFPATTSISPRDSIAQAHQQGSASHPLMPSQSMSRWLGLPFRSLRRMSGGMTLLRPEEVAMLLQLLRSGAVAALLGLVCL